MPEAKPEAEAAPQPHYEAESAIVAKLIAKFPALADKITIKKAKRIYCQAVPAQDFMPILEYLVQDLGINTLSGITGIDEGDLVAAYHIYNEADGIAITLKQSAPRDHAVFQSVYPIFNGSTFYERELIDLFGIEIIGLPGGLPRYPLPDGWPEGQYPMRKDWDRETMDWSKIQAETMHMKGEDANG